MICHSTIIDEDDVDGVHGVGDDDVARHGEACWSGWVLSLSGGQV